MNERPIEGWKLQVDSFSKLIVYFKEGKPRTFYSLDWKHKYSNYRDRQLGLYRLRKLIHKYSDKADGAVIYDTQTREPIEKYYEGILLDPRDETI